MLNSPTPPACGIALIKQKENCKLAAYLDGEGNPTIGWGHTLGVKLGDTCTQQQADAWLIGECADFWDYIIRKVKVTLTDNQGGALLCWVYNNGKMAFCDSTLLSVLNLGQYDYVPDQIRRWKYIKVDGKKVVCQGLVNRRESEVALWNAGGKS